VISNENSRPQVFTNDFEFQKYIATNTDMSKTENPILSGWDEDGMAERRSCEDYFWRSLEYDKLLHDNPNENSRPQVFTNDFEFQKYIATKRLNCS